MSAFRYCTTCNTPMPKPTISEDLIDKGQMCRNGHLNVRYWTIEEWLVDIESRLPPPVLEAVAICPDCRGERRIKGRLCKRCKGDAQIPRNQLRVGETAPFEPPIFEAR